MRRTKKLTPQMLRRLVIQERRKLQREVLEQGVEDSEKVKAKEVDADGYADSLEKDIDHMKVLQIKEARLKKQLRKILESRKLLRKRIIRKL